VGGAEADAARLRLDIGSHVKPNRAPAPRRKAHHPATLLGILAYGYCTGVFSSRKLERATYDSAAFRYIAAGSHPNHDTLASFRRRFVGELAGLFVQVLEMADTTPMQAMTHRLSTIAGKAAYAMRKQTVEPVFGIIKSVMGFRGLFFKQTKDFYGF
jgi:hypothetical protein